MNRPPLTKKGTHMRFTAMLAIALLSAGPAAASDEPAAKEQAPGPAAERVPDPLRELLDREAPALPKAELELPREAGALSAEVEASGEVQVAREGEADALTIPIGTEQPIRCFVSSVRTDGASPIASVLQRMKDGTKVLSVRPVEVAAVSGSPALFVEAVYATAQNDGKSGLGQLKQAVVPHPDRSLTCLHDEPGYARTFRRVVKGLAASLAAAAPDVRSQARFAEITAVRVKDLPVGFVEQTIMADRDGGSTVRLFSSLLVPRSAGELRAEDKVVVHQLDRAGRIVSSTIAQSSGGQVETNVTLERGPDRKTYSYRGTLRGKQVEGRFATRDGLASDLLVSKRTPLLLSGKSKEERFEELVSDEPVRPARTAYRKGAGSRRVTLELPGGTSVRLGLDANGWPSLMEIPAGAVTVTYERIWSRGQP